MALGRQILDRPLDAAGNAVAGLPHAATGDAAERHDDVVAQVAAEAAARAAADTAEATARAAGDTTLTTNLNTEIANRIAGDTNAINVSETFATNAIAAARTTLETDGIATGSVQLVSLAFPTAGAVICRVASVRDEFVLDRTSTLTADGITVVTALGGTGRWIRRNIPSLYWATQLVWYVDSVNGNDENEGDTPGIGNALKTRSEYARRTDGLQLTGITTINLVADLLATDTTLPFRPQTSVQANGASGFKIRYQGTKKALFTGTLTNVVNRNGGTHVTTKLTSSWTVSSLIGMIVEGVNASAALVRGVIVADLGGGQAWVSIPVNSGLSGEDTFANGTTVTVYDGVNLSPGGSPTIQTVPYGYVEFDYCRAPAWEFTGSYISMSNCFGVINCHGHIHNFLNCSMTVQLQAGIGTVGGGYVTLTSTQNTTFSLTFGGVTVKNGIFLSGGALWSRNADVEINATTPAITVVSPDTRAAISGNFYGTVSPSTQVVKFNSGVRNSLVQFASIPSLGGAADLVFTDAGLTGSTATLAAAQVNDTNLNRVIGPAGPTLNDNASQPIAHLGSGGTTPTNAANIGDAQAIAAAAIASIRTPKPGEFWVACIDQDGLTLSGNDATGAIGIASPGQQTRTVTVTGADTAVASTKTLHFTNGAFTANDQYGELVIGNATNAGSYRIKTVVGGTDVIVEGGPIVNETFSGSVTLTVIGGPKATRDAALTAAKLTPFKTLDRLKEVLPRVGSGANLMVLARARSGGAATPYTLKDLTTPGDMTWSNGLTGWTMIFFRPTDNFVNDLDDKIRSGYQVLAGTASGGYVATAGATVSNIPCQLASGGAASLPAENFAISGIGGVIGYRLRFLSTTPTVALRNWAIMIHRSTSSSVVPAKDLPTVPLPNTDPSGGDKFVIEQSGFWVFDGTLSLGSNGRSTFIGVGSTGTTGVNVELACPCNSNAAFAGWEVQPNIHMGLGAMPQNSSLFSDLVVDEMGGYLPSQTGLVIGLQIGIGYRGRLDNNGQNNVTVLSSCDISDTPRTWAGAHSFQKLGGGSIFKSGVTIVASDMGLNPWGMSGAEAFDTITGELGTLVNSFGSDGRPGYRKLRIPTASSTNGVGIVGGAMRVRGIEFDSAAGSLIGIGGVGTKVVVDDISTTAGSGSYPSAVVDTFVYSSTVAPAVACTVVIGTRVPVTASTSAGDIRLSDGSFVAFSALASQFVEDANGNRFVGTAGLAHAADSVPARSGATAGALADVALTPSTVLARGPSGHIAAIPFSTIAGAGTGITALTGDVAATGPGSAAATIQPLAVDTGKIANAAITNAKRANMAASTLSGNATGSPAAPTDLTAAAVKTLLAISATADVSGLAAIATTGSANDLIAGTLPAGRFPALTGDVTTTAGSLATTLANLPQAVLLARTGALTAALPMNAQKITGLADPSNPQDAATKHYVDASFSGGVPLVDGDKGDVVVSSSGAVWTVDTDVVTFAKMQNIPTDTIIGRDTAGTGDPESITVGGGIEFTGSGGIQRSALTGDVSASAGSAGTVINPNVVTNAQLAQVPTGTLKGRTAAGTGNTSDLTFAAVKAALAIVFADITGTLQAAQFPALTGDVTTPGGSLVTTLAASGVIAATYGDASHVAQVTVDAKGRVTAASSPSISITAGAVSGLSTTQTGPLTGDVTKPAGSGITTLANIPNDTPMAGDVLATQIADPAAPAAGKTRIYASSADPVLKAIAAGGVVTHTVRSHAAIAHQFLIEVTDDGNTAGARPDFSDLTGVIQGTQFSLAADTLVGNNTGSTGPAQTLTPAQVRTMLGLDNPQSFEFQVSWGIGDGMNSESVPIRTIVGSWAFWLQPTTRASDIPILGYTSGNHDANLTNPAVAWELPVDATYGHCDLLYQVETWDPQSNSSPTAPNVLLSVSKNKSIDSSPCALTITAAGASATNPQPFSFVRGDLIGVRIAPSASFGNSGVAHLKMTVKVRLTP